MVTYINWDRDGKYYLKETIEAIKSDTYSSMEEYKEAVKRKIKQYHAKGIMAYKSRKACEVWAPEEKI